ncbi:MAG TPA: SRPBCC family protein [Azonexus sp.]|nr:SRPBCC family protein [Azonexus sp.]
MNFEHLIQINDLQNPLIVVLSRDQLWQGLLHRVEDATPFLPGLESCTIVERHADHLLRKLDFGPAVIEDRVTLSERQWVRFDILPNEQHAGGSLTISIEEPEPDALFLRFAYTTSFASNPNSEDRAYIDYIKSAYHQSDIDCVRIIRTLAAGGSPQ